MVRLKLSKRTIASSCVAARPESLKYFAPPARKLRHDDRDVAFARDHRILAVGIALKRCIRLNSVTVLFQFTFNLQCTSQAYPGISPAMMTGFSHPRGETGQRMFKSCWPKRSTAYSNGTTSQTAFQSLTVADD
jgi:hypothetical protein